MHVVQRVGAGLFLAPALLLAGTYAGTVDCTNDDTPVPPRSNFCIAGKTPTGETIHPFGITHPPGFDGSGGTIEISVCIDSSMTPSADLIQPTQSAIATWSALLPRTGTCQGCFTIEEGDGPAAPVPYHAETILLHELGHCALGLGHPNLEFDPVEQPPVEGRERTSFTMSYQGSPLGTSPGTDGIQVHLTTYSKQAEG